MGDADLAVLIKVVSAVFLLIPFTSLFRGYFQGSGNTVPTAYSQVTEQLIRVGTILAVSIILVKEGLDLYKVGAGAVLGSVTGGASGLFVLAVFLWLKRKPAGTLRISAGELADFHDAKIIFKALFVQGFAICISNMLLIFMQLADSLNLYSLLLETGMDMDVAKGLKGVYDRGQPLIQLGAVVATSMSLSLVPLITNEKMREKHNPFTALFSWRSGSVLPLVLVRRRVFLELWSRRILCCLKTAKGPQCCRRWGG